MVPQGPCPELSQTSLPLAITDNDEPAPELARLQLFESRAFPDKTGCVAHVGGAVVALDWNPARPGLLALAALPAGTPALGVTQAYFGRGHIQLWASSEGDATAHCVACIAHEGFAAVDLKWAPNAHPDTASLLAAAFADGSVVVYALRGILPQMDSAGSAARERGSELIAPPHVSIRSAGATFSIRRQKLPVLCRSLAWSVDGCGLAVGTTDGAVTVFNLHVQGYHVACLDQGRLANDGKGAVPGIYESWSVTLHPGAAVLAMEWLSPQTLATSGTEGLVRVGDVRDPAVSTESLVDRNIWTTSMKCMPSTSDCFVVGNDQGHLRFVYLRGEARFHACASPASTLTANILLKSGTVRSVTGIPIQCPQVKKENRRPDAVPGATTLFKRAGSVHVKPHVDEANSLNARKPTTLGPSQDCMRVLVYAGCSSGSVHEVDVGWPPWSSTNNKLDTGVQGIRRILSWRPVTGSLTASAEGEAAPETGVRGLVADVGRKYVKRNKGGNAIQDDEENGNDAATVFGPDYVHETVASRLSADSHRGLLAIGTLGGFLTIVNVSSTWKPETRLITASSGNASDGTPSAKTAAPKRRSQPVIKGAQSESLPSEPKNVYSEAEVAERKARALERKRARLRASKRHAERVAEAARKRERAQEETERLVQLREEGMRSIEARLEARRLKAQAVKPVLEEQKRLRQAATEKQRAEKRKLLREESARRRAAAKAAAQRDPSSQADGPEESENK